MVDRQLESIILQKPILWVGAGLSVAAGYPSTGALVSALRAAADRDLPEGDFTAVVDAFVDAVGAGELSDVLQRHFQTPHDPTPTHAAIARLAAAGFFTAIVTTNYDALLERALDTAGVKVVLQTLEDNAAVREQDGALRLYKIHGSYNAWHAVILSGRSYADFDARYGFLRAQLDVLLQQHPLLFVGCSLQDPRVLQWLEARPAEWITKLKRWRALMQHTAWTAAQNMPWKGGTAGSVLKRAPLQSIEYQRHVDLAPIWLELARKLAPLAIGELVFDLHPGEDEWRSTGPTPESEPHTAPNPLHNAEFLRSLRRLHTLLHRSVQVNHPDAHAHAAEARHVARSVGARLTDMLLSPAAREAVRRRFAEVERGTARLTLRVAEGPGANAALALPWELLMPEDGHFAVEGFKLDLVRDAVKPGAPDLDVPSTPLSVAVTIAAPDGPAALRYEDESYRMLKALAPLGQAAHFAELGELDDLVELVRRTDATVVHFSGHGLPGKLVFEDDLGLPREVPVTELTTRLRQRVQQSGTARPFPRLFYLASCHGASATLTAPGSSELDTRTLRAELSAVLGEGPSTAATLHREGFACVLGYFGPVGDAASTSAEVALYTALSEGSTVLQAVKQARAQLSQPHTHADQHYHYPLGWAQLAVYLRGPDRPLTASPKSAPSTVTPPPLLARDIVQVSGLPVLEHGFIGRRALQHEVRRKLKAGQRLLVLQGLGGLGKTALASQLLCNVLTRDRADQLILRAGESADIALLRRQAEEHGDTHRLPDWGDEIKRLHERYPEPVEGFKQTVLSLKAHRPGLVLYADNMEDLQVGPGGAAELEPGAVGTWRPGVERWWDAMEALAKHVIVLASTRYLWADPAPDALVPLDRMSRADVWRMVETFPTLAKLPWPVREKVADKVDGRPRTLVRLEGLLSKTHSDPTRNISDAWKEWISPVLEKHGDLLTADLLLNQLWHCISQAARDHAIAVSVLHQAAPRRVLDALGDSAAELIGAGLLTRYRALAAEPSGDGTGLVWEDRWSMHTSVQKFAFAWGSSDQHRHARHVAAKEYIVTLAEPGAFWSDQLEAINLYLANDDGPAAWPLARHYVLWLRDRAQYTTAVQMLQQFSHAGLLGDHHVEHTALLSQIRGSAGIRHNTSEEDLRKNVAAANSPSTKSFALSELAALLSRHGKYGEADLFLRESLSLREQTHGHNDPEYCITLHNVGHMVWKQGKYPEAERLLRECLGLKERVLGHDHSEYSTTLNELALVLCEQGKHPEAEHLLQDALDRREKNLGREHPDYATSLHNLASVFLLQGKHAEAEDTLRNAIAIKEKTLGREHPHYGDSLHMLARVHIAQGRFHESEVLIRECISLRIVSLGPEHPDYSASIHVLASALAKQGKFSEAERLLRESMNLTEKALGHDHPGYGASLSNLAGVLLQQDQVLEAERLLRACGAIVEKALGREHPDYCAYLNELARVLMEQGNYAEAEHLFRDALSIHQKLLGNGHPTQCAILMNLAVVAEHQDRATEGILLLEQALRIGHATLGAGHPTMQEIQRRLQRRGRG